MRSRCAAAGALPVTTRPPFEKRVKSVTAFSISLVVRTPAGLTSIPIDCAAGCQAEANRIDENLRDNRDGVCQLLESHHARSRARHKHVRLDTKQLFRKRRRASAIAIEVAAFKGPVLALRVSEFPHALQKSTEIALRHRFRAANQTGDKGARRSLGYARNWPQRRASREARNEFPSPHGALKPRTTPYHILEWEDCASQQNRALDFRFGSTAVVSGNPR